MRGCRYRGEGEYVSVDIKVVHQHLDTGGDIFGDGYRIRNCGWQVVYVRHGDTHNGACDAAPSVSNGIGEGVVTREIRIRCIGDISRSPQHDRATCGLRNIGYAQNIPVRIGIVRGHIESKRRVFDHGHTVVDSHGKIVDRRNCYRDDAIISAALPVGHRVCERVGTEEIGVRHIAHGRPANGGNTIRGGCDRSDHQRVPINVGVIAQNPNDDRRVLGCTRDVIACYGWVVCCDNVHGDRGAGRPAFAIADRIGKRSQTRKIRGGRINH